MKQTILERALTNLEKNTGPKVEWELCGSDDRGKIEVREPYWMIENEQPNIAPLLTIYTDLMESGDLRSMNITKRLYEKAPEN